MRHWVLLIHFPPCNILFLNSLEILPSWSPSSWLLSLYLLWLFLFSFLASHRASLLLFTYTLKISFIFTFPARLSMQIIPQTLLVWCLPNLIAGLPHRDDLPAPWNSTCQSSSSSSFPKWHHRVIQVHSLGASEPINYIGYHYCTVKAIFN